VRTRIVILCFLAVLAVSESRNRFSGAGGVDFYHYWGVAKAIGRSEGTLGSPYTAPERFAELLNVYADSAGDERLKSVNRQRRELDVTGTPLFYASFGFLPDDYSLAFGIYQILQVALLIAALGLLGRRLGAPLIDSVTLALVAVVVYWPVISDLRVGNINCIQLFLLVAITLFADRGLDDRSGAASAARQTAVLSVLGLLTLFKPNVAVVTLLLAAHLWVRLGALGFLRAAIPAAAVSAAAFAYSCWTFASWTIWREWLELVAARPVYPTFQGNYSTPALLDGVFGIGLRAATLGIGVLLLLSAWATYVRARPTGRPGVAALRDPWYAVSVGVVITLATAKLAWSHYFVLSLLPALWLLWSPAQSGAILAATSLLLTSAVLPAILIPLGGRSFIAYTVAASWVPLWIGVLRAGRRQIDV
jgi:hypothetical protein